MNAKDAVRELFQNALLIELDGSIKDACRDPKDDMILECAVLANAQFIISSDKDLTALDPSREIRIVKPRVFIDRLTA